MPLESRFHVGRGILQGNPGVRVTLRDLLREEVCHAQELLFAGFPHTDQHCARSDTGV